MIDNENILQELGNAVALLVADGLDNMELAAVAERVLGQNVHTVSVGPSAVSVLWPWLESANVKILSRFYFNELNKNNPDIDVSNLVQAINSVFRQGADGAQIFIKQADLPIFTKTLSVIRDDLFFNKDLSIGISLNEIKLQDWGILFHSLKEINASSLMLAFPTDEGDDSDFVGKIFAMLDAWDADFAGTVHFAFGKNLFRMWQARRLIEKKRPELLQSARFFIAG